MAVKEDGERRQGTEMEPDAVVTKEEVRRSPMSRTLTDDGFKSSSEFDSPRRAAGGSQSGYGHEMGHES